MSDNSYFSDISLKKLISEYWKRALPTWIMVFFEALFLILIPLAIGMSVDDFISGKIAGIIKLGSLCLMLLIVGAGRRFYDTRVYSSIYRKTAFDLVLNEQRKRSSISSSSARLNLFGEFTEFLEESLPAIIHEVFNLLGVILIILFINLKIALFCVASAVFVSLVYIFTEKKIYSLNKGLNGEFEKQVSILENEDSIKLRKHFSLLTFWRIKLSDLETMNYSIIWIILSAALVISVVTIADSGKTTTGDMVSSIMYVFGFMESILAFPIYYQQMVRLREISFRLSS